jgi:D-beta-D-heptose 7-phosphate kinase/D-beta-D-heptose 1-phosphate adenosyltransferase
MSGEGARNGGDLAARLDRLTAARVLVLGDVMLDRFLSGTVERISPEAPVPVLRIERESAMLGGAGNVLRNLRALGASARLLAVVGDDAAGQDVRRLVEESGARSEDVLIEAGRGTTIKERFSALGQQLLRTDRECRPRLDSQTRVALLGRVERALAESDVLIVSDYGKGVLDRETLDTVIQHARGRGLPVIVDPKGRDFTLYKGASLVTPNRRELSEAAGQACDSLDAVASAAQEVIYRSGVDAILATLSGEGMLLVEGAREPRHFPAEAREVYDVSGAGDTVVAALAAGLGAGFDIAEAVSLANLAAGVVVGKRGTATAEPDEILRAFHAARLLRAESKLADADTAVGIVEGWRAAGLRVAFTNGVFDLLHPGHVSLLQQARAAADRLVVGMNSDASVRRLKGETRPIQDETARAAVLASMAPVDLVVVFGEDTPLELIEALKPDLLVKGADYTRDTVVGADIVEAHGGRVLLAELTPGQSTTNTIKRLKG